MALMAAMYKLMMPKILMVCLGVPSSRVELRMQTSMQWLRYFWFSTKVTFCRGGTQPAIIISQRVGSSHIAQLVLSSNRPHQRQQWALAGFVRSQLQVLPELQSFVMLFARGIGGVVTGEVLKLHTFFHLSIYGYHWWSQIPGIS